MSTPSELLQMRMCKKYKKVWQTEYMSTLYFLSVFFSFQQCTAANMTVIRNDCPPNCIEAGLILLSIPRDVDI